MSARRPTIVFQPETMRFRAVPVLTNTVPKGAQRGPGENQAANMFEPLLDKAARELGIDRLAIRHLVNAPGNGGGAEAKYGKDQGPVTSAYLKEALEKGCGAVQLGRALAALGRAQRLQGEGVRRSAKPIIPQARTALTASCASRLTASFTSIPVSAISAPSPTPRPRGSPPRCWAMTGSAA